MKTEDMSFSEEYKTSTAEMILIGHILNNFMLLEQYRDCLTQHDFQDGAMRVLYGFICDFHKNYSTEKSIEFREEKSMSKVNMLYLQWKIDDKNFQKYFPSDKKFKEMLKTLKCLGDENSLADNMHYHMVKKASCLRQLKEAGIDTSFIESNENFAGMTSDEMMRLVSDKVDELSQHCMLHPSIDLVSTIKDTACRFMVEPDCGLQTPFHFINDHIHGLRRNDLTMIGANTNCGKSRMLVYILTYLVCIEKQSVLLLSNELTKDQFQKILICTVVNMPQLCELHGQKLCMTQSEITQPHFYSTEGEFMEILPDESYEDYIKRLESESEDFSAYLKVLDWFQENYQNMFHFKNISDDYSIERIKQEVHIAKKHGCTVVAYDTLKGYGNADWCELQQTATELSELIKSDPDGITGLATFQLTDDTLNRKPEDLNSTSIANAKHIMHVADNMLMFKVVNNAEFCLEVDGNTDQKQHIPLPCSSKVAGFKIVKNRNGAGKDTLFGVQMNLDYNIWHYAGELKRVYGK